MSRKEDLKDGIIKNRANTNNINNICEYFDSFEEIYDYISKLAKKGDIVVTMGAGDVYKLLDKYNFE